MARAARGCRGVLAAGGCGRRRGPGRAGRGALPGPGLDRPGHGDVGQQRGRQHPAHRGDRRTGAPGRRSGPLRCRPGLRLGARGFPGHRAGRHVHLRAQDRRPGRRRRAAAGPRREADPGPARRGTGTRRPLRNPGHRVHRRLRRGGRGGHRQSSGGSGAHRRAPGPADRRRPGSGAGRRAARGSRARTAAGQRPLHLPRLRRRLAAVPARSGRGGILHRIGLHGGGAPAVPRAAGHGTGRGHRPGRPAVQPGPFLHRSRRRCAAGRPARRLHPRTPGRHGRPRVQHPDRRNRRPPLRPRTARPPAAGCRAGRPDPRGQPGSRRFLPR